MTIKKIEVDETALTPGRYVLQDMVTTMEPEISRVIIEVTQTLILVRGHCFNYDISYEVSAGTVFTVLYSTSLGAAGCEETYFQNAETDIFNWFQQIN